jgi:recombination protein RecA
MFSMLNLAALFPSEKRLDLGVSDVSHAPKVPLSTGLAALDQVLPDGGLPRGAVVELSSPRGLARSTSIALSTCASAQSDARQRGTLATVGAWCAWLDPTATLQAFGAHRVGVDLTRLLVVRPPVSALARVGVRVAASRAFAVVVLDLAGVPGVSVLRSLDRWGVVVRRLALAAEGNDTTILLLTDASAARSMPLPVALRLELTRDHEDGVVVRVAKDRRGRVAPSVAIAWPAELRLAKTLGRTSSTNDSAASGKSA